MKVLVVTDIRLYREGVAEALRRFPDVEEAVTAAATVMWSWSTCRSPTVPIPYGRWSLRGRALKGVALGCSTTIPAWPRTPRSVRVDVSREATVDELGEALRSDNIAARLALLLGPVRFGGADQRH